MEIHVLSSETINKIAAGEVVERPRNVVKELAENAIDAGSTAITIEIRDGGISLIRVTDNGCGIEESQVRNAFRRHATSKIQDETDLENLSSLGFRGEALSSIAAVAEVEMMTRTKDAVTGVRVTNDLTSGADPEQALVPLNVTKIGAPAGTTVIVRNLFCNVPVRRKFLKSAQTEGSYITDLVENLALSHPEISFHYRVNGQERLHTTGNGKERELIHRIYGKELAARMIPFSAEEDGLSVSGYLGRPEHSKSSRAQEIFFVNDRILKSEVLSRGLEEGYRTDLMQHRFPFAIVHLRLPADQIDVNVHPAKLEVRFQDSKRVFDFLNESVHAALHAEELIPKATALTAREELEEAKKAEAERAAQFAAEGHFEPFEAKARPKTEEPAAPFAQPKPTVLPVHSIPAVPAPERKEEEVKSFSEGGFSFDDLRPAAPAAMPAPADEPAEEMPSVPERVTEPVWEKTPEKPAADLFPKDPGVYSQVSLFDEAAEPEEEEESAPADALALQAASLGKEEGAEEDEALRDYRKGQDEKQKKDLSGNMPVFTRDAASRYRIIGQAFGTYWIIEYEDQLLFIDQHAAHEKINFEKLMDRLEKKAAVQAPSQLLSPPIIMTLTGREEGALKEHWDVFARMGYELEDFGEHAYAIRAVPLELYANAPDALIREILEEILGERMSGTPAAILYKIASMSCKAAVKGNTRISEIEAKALIDRLLSLDNPYHCPHGRPTMILISEKELERKFKRIV